MDILTTAAAYILDIVTENEDFKKFPKEFVGESVKWVKSWFLTPEDPKATAKLEDPKKSIEVKKDIIGDKLDDLKENPQFMKELEAQLHALAAAKRTLLNVIEDSDVEVKGNFRQGNTGGASKSTADETNIVKRSKIVVGGDFRQGDDIQQGNTIVNNHYHGVSPSATSAVPPQYNDLKKALNDLLSKGKTLEVVNRLLEHTERTDADAYQITLNLSGQHHRLERQDTSGIMGFENARLERNRLSNALIQVIDGLKQ